MDDASCFHASSPKGIIPASDTRACFSKRETPVGVERLGVALEPHESYEVNSGGGGVEDPRVVYVPRLKRYVMTYTAFVPYEPRVAIAVSSDLLTWQRLGCLRFEIMADGRDLNTAGTKTRRSFPRWSPTPRECRRLRSCIGLRRACISVAHHDGTKIVQPPSGDETQENIWISYIAVTPYSRTSRA
jgi:hypothetical protein